MSDFDELWTRARAAGDKAESIRNLAGILSSKEGRMFILGLEPSDVELCIGLMDHVRSVPPSTTIRSDGR